MRLLYHIVAGFLFIGIIITFAGLIMFFYYEDSSSF